ncbi:MAG: Dabb family protein [Oligoflexia bacterium]|nr:Dabb family protein [Oligoflexia bacterium]
MITRYIFIKLTEAGLADRADLATACVPGLGAVPGVRAVQVALPADPDSAHSWDLCLKVRFDDIAAVQAYVPHPVHRAFVADVLAPVVACKRVWNFEELPLAEG